MRPASEFTSGCVGRGSQRNTSATSVVWKMGAPEAMTAFKVARVAADQSTTGVPRMPHSSAIVVEEVSTREAVRRRWCQAQGSPSSTGSSAHSTVIEPRRRSIRSSGIPTTSPRSCAISEQSANDEDRLTDLLLRREPDVLKVPGILLNRSPLAQCGPTRLASQDSGTMTVGWDQRPSAMEARSDSVSRRRNRSP